MNDITPEFSRLVPVVRLGLEPFRQRIEATPEEREGLAHRLDLLALDRFAADVELRRNGAQVIILEAAFAAEFEQCCSVTLEPVRTALADTFSLIYGPAENEQREVTLSPDEPALEPLTGDVIDIGEAVTQGLSLALPQFPRHPEANIDDLAEGAPEKGPFTSLAHFRKCTGS
jgi:uncharacterized metal-binding protein YceD (DUF177 family)